ncbi:COG1361 S-layer family protein [Candidatus Woesearchaeota archaeon]|nr:COG1361 S-layer family protein [Candidatus Woesearchaeota archaeon]
MKKAGKIKLTFLVLIAFVILMGLVLNANAKHVSGSSKVNITLRNQEPDPVEPGTYVDLKFRAENLGSEEAKDVYVKIAYKFPFSIEAGESEEIYLGSLYGRQTGDNAVNFEFRLKIDKDAVEGNNEIEIFYKRDKLSWIKMEPFTVRIRTYDAILAVDSVNTVPKKIPPGSNAKVKIGLKNLADSLIRDIVIRLDLSSDDLPFVPVDSTTEKKLYQIGSLQSDVMEFTIMATASADSGAYKVPINLTYVDLAGTVYTKNDYIGIIIGTKPDLAVVIEDSEIYKKRTSGKVTLKFINKGLIDLKLMNIKLDESDGFEIVSSDEVYVGNIDSDDYETAEFDLYVKGWKSEVILPIIIDYMDANNQRYRDKEDVILKLYSSGKAKKYGLEEKGSVGVLIVIMIAGAGGYYYWRKRKKKKMVK